MTNQTVEFLKKNHRLISTSIWTCLILTAIFGGVYLYMTVESQMNDNSFGIKYQKMTCDELYQELKNSNTLQIDTMVLRHLQLNYCSVNDLGDLKGALMDSVNKGDCFRTYEMIQFYMDPQSMRQSIPLIDSYENCDFDGSFIDEPPDLSQPLSGSGSASSPGGGP